MSDLIKRLDEYIEYATNVKRFADVAFYEELKARVVELEKVVDAVKSLNLDKVEGYMLLGKSYKQIIVEALNNLNQPDKG